MHPDGAAQACHGSDAGRCVLRLGLSPSTAEVRRALGVAARWCTRIGLCATCRERAELLLAEILNNIVEHAGAGPEPDAILLEMRRKPRCLLIRVRDSGQPMPSAIPEAALPDPADLPEGGFGWFLIRQLADTVSYARVADGNCLSVRIVTDRPHRAARRPA